MASTTAISVGGWRFLASAAILAMVTTAAHARDTLKVCGDPDNLPFSDEAGAGFENKIAALMGKRMGLPVEYAWFPQNRGFIRQTLKSEVRPGVYKCDVVMGVPSAYELAAPTVPYYSSTWVLVYAKGRGIDDVKSASDFATLPKERRAKIRLGIFDQGPGQLWAFYNDMMTKAVPYVARMSHVKDSPLKIVEDVIANKIDAAIVWGPFAGHYQKEKKGGDELVLLSLADEQDPARPEMRFVYKISMAVRYPDKEWKGQVNSFIEENRDAIGKILEDFGVPLVPLAPAE